MFFTFFANIFCAFLYFIMADLPEAMFGAATNILEQLNILADTSGVEGMTASWLQAIDSAHNHFPSPAMRVFNGKIIRHLEFSCKKVSYLMWDCVFLKMVKIPLDKLKIQIDNATLHWLYIPRCSTLLEKFNTLEWDVDIKFGRADGESLFDIMLGKLHYI